MKTYFYISTKYLNRFYFTYLTLLLIYVISFFLTWQVEGGTLSDQSILGIISVNTFTILNYPFSKISLLIFDNYIFSMSLIIFNAFIYTFIIYYIYDLLKSKLKSNVP